MSPTSVDTPSDEVARLRAELAAEKGWAPAPASCPPGETIWRAVRGELSRAEVGELVDHFVGCPACAEEWRLAMAFEAEGVAQPRRPPHRLWQVAAAAGVAAAVGLGLWQLLPSSPAGYRNAGGSGIEALVTDGAALPRERFVLSWRPIPSAASYELSVHDQDLNALADARGLTRPEFQVPAAALARLPAGAPVYWFVTPVLAGGERGKPSQTFRAVVR